MESVESFSPEGKKPPTKWAKNLLKFAAPLLILFIYTAVMAGIFYAIEKDCSVIFHCPATIITLRRFVDSPIAPLAEQVPTTIGWHESSTISDWSSTEEPYIMKTTIPAKIKTSTRTEYKVSKNMTDKAPWSHLTYFVAFHFVFISITTIGYGDIYPCSSGGELLTILFTIVGIPITLMALTRTAKLFALGLHKVWLFIHKKVKKPPYTPKQQRYIDHEGYVPVLSGVILLVIWMLLSAEYFFMTLFNDYNPDPDTPPFTYFLAFYFTMISFLTIGFGDYAPIKYEMIFITSFFLIIGLSLVTMCIDLAQLEFDMFFQEVVDMIEDQYKVSLEDDDKQANVKKTNVDHLIKTKSSFSKRMMTSFMGKHTHEHLAIAHEHRINSGTMQIQTSVQVQDLQIQADIAEKRVDFSCQFDLLEEEDDFRIEREEKRRRVDGRRMKNATYRKKMK